MKAPAKPKEVVTEFSTCCSTNQKHIKPFFPSSDSDDSAHDGEEVRTPTEWRLGHVRATRPEVTAAETVCKGPVVSNSSCASWTVGCFLQALPATPSPVCSPARSPRSSSRRGLLNSRTKIGLKEKVFSSDKKSTLSELEDGAMHQGRPVSLRNRRASGVNKVLNYKIDPEPSASFSRSASNGDNSMPDVMDEKTSLLPGDNEGTSKTGSTAYDSCISLLPTHGRPFHDFLEIKTREIMAKLVAWKEAKIVNLMNKLNKKESEICVWKNKETAEAKAELKKIERKMENKRKKALDQMQKKINQVEMKANMKKMKQRDSTVKKISKLSNSIDQVSTTGKLPWRFFCL